MNLPLSVIEHHPYPKNLIPISFIVFFALAVSLILFLIFPGRFMFNMIMSSDAPDPVALFYLERLSITYPHDKYIRGAFIHQQIGLNKLKEARENITLFEKNADAHDVVTTLKYDYLVVEIDQLNKRKVKTHDKIKELNVVTDEVLKLRLSEKEWLTLANTALRYNWPNHALSFYMKADTVKKNPKIAWYLMIAKTAMQSSNYQVASDYYLKAAAIQPNITIKREYIKDALYALQSGNMSDKGLTLAANLPAEIIQDVNFLFFLSQYALAANQPDLARQYVERAISLEGESR